MERKKVLYIHHSGRLGGAPKSLCLLVDRIDREKYEPIILTIKNGPAIKLLQDTGAKVIIKPYLFPYHGTTVSGMNWKVFLKNNLFLIHTFIGAIREIKKINPDLIHLNTTALFAFAAASKLLCKKRKVICHVREPLLNNIWGKILKYANHYFVDGYISICHNDEKTVITKNKPSVVVYNFIDFNLYNPNIKNTILRKELKLDKDDIICLCLSRISEPNGILELIQRFNRLPKNFNRFKLVVVGLKRENKYEKACITETKKNTNTFILPFRIDVPQIIASSDIFICPFTQAHFSRGIIEASSMGKPILGNNIGGVNELIKDKTTGYLFDIHNQANFEEKLEIMKSRSTRQKLGNNAYLFANENFDAQKNAAKTFNFYEQFF